MDLNHLKALSEAKTPKWGDLYGKLMDEASNIESAMGEGDHKVAKTAAKRMLAVAKALHKEIESQ